MLCDSPQTSRSRVVQRIAILLLATVFAHCGWAAESVPQELPPQEEQAASRRDEATGLTIFKHDHAAAVATDALGALGILKSDKRLRGWITQEQAEGILVTFISGDANEAPQALYRVSVSKEGEVTGPPQELNGIRVARGRGANLCWEVFLSALRGALQYCSSAGRFIGVAELGGLSHTGHARRAAHPAGWRAPIGT
jgi:hypothetical protein